jgi:uncharacterized protein YdiU (UPF0061 family)
MDSLASFTSPVFERLPLVPRFAGLGEPYATAVPSTPLREPRLIHLNRRLAAELGFDEELLRDPSFTDVMAGNKPWPGYTSIASVYAGHQFGTYVPQLGDGRALMIAEVRTPSGARTELQLKGAGQTPYSRFADGRAVLRSSIREYLCSEAMHALGIPTTRALALIASPEPVRRETIESAAVVCRVAPSFVRFGHFEFFYYHSEHERLAPLADHVIDENFPQFSQQPDRYAAWLRDVVERTARLMAHWQAVGFCHGVMNTDNFSALGLTLDYGPFGFIDAFDAHHVCNHSDEGGRYAYDQQPLIGHWNCSRLLQATLPLLSDNMDKAVEIANTILERYPPVYMETMRRLWADKIGLRELREGDENLINRFLSILHRGHSDFTRSFRHLARVRTDTDAPAAGMRDEIADLEAFDAWVVDYRARLRAEQSQDEERSARMNRVNPKYVLRNHLVQIAIEKAQGGDFGEIDTLMKLLEKPFDEHPEMEAYAAEPPAALRHIEVSCSS